MRKKRRARSSPSAPHLSGLASGTTGRGARRNLVPAGRRGRPTRLLGLDPAERTVRVPALLVTRAVLRASGSEPALKAVPHRDDRPRTVTTPIQVRCPHRNVLRELLQCHFGPKKWHLGPLSGSPTGSGQRSLASRPRSEGSQTRSDSVERDYTSRLLTLTLCLLR